MPTCCVQAPTTLAELAELVGGEVHKRCAPNTVLDLGGRELGGDLPGGDLRLSVLGLVLRNGTLPLPDGAIVVVKAAEVRLEELTFRDTAPRVLKGEEEMEDGDVEDTEEAALYCDEIDGLVV